MHSAADSSSTTRAGWIAGGGVEYMLARNWTAKIEGLYAGFGNSTVAGQSALLSTYRSRFAHEVATVRGGLNWKW
jgi:outer membrane immunogenic protein